MIGRGLTAAVLAALAAFTIADPSIAGAPPKGNAACWGDNARQDITCQPFTDSFLLGLENDTEDQIRAAMGVSGIEIDGNLQFISNYTHGRKIGSGVMNFTFGGDGEAYIIFGARDLPAGAPADFIWNEALLPEACSNLPNSHLRRCPDGGDSISPLPSN